MIKHLPLLILFFSAQSIAQYATEESIRSSAKCTEYGKTYDGKPYKVSCGREVQLETDNRPQLHIDQPVGPKDLKSACNKDISSAQSYNLVANPLSCGEGAIAHDRIQTPLSKQVMNQWSIASRSGTPDAQKRMQEIRKIEIKYDGEIEYPVFESWTYEARDGGYSSSCGMENWDTQCSVSRTKTITEKVSVTDYSNCLEYETDPDPDPVVVPVPSPAPRVQPNNRGGYTPSPAPAPARPRQDTYRPDKSPVDRTIPKQDKGKGESKEELKNNRKKRFEGNIRQITFDRSPASRQCKRYGKKFVDQDRDEVMDPIVYRCQKQRPKWCTWPIRVPVSRKCNNQKVKYTVEYKHDPKWVPGYTDSKGRHRDYQQILPNKFELLLGESENFTVFSNYGESENMKPSFKIESKWNEYTYNIEPKSIKCEFQKDAQFKVDIHTVGRNLVKAPNPLALPKDADGKDIFPLVIENGKPVRILLQDLGRMTQIRAGELSRQFSKPHDAVQAKREVIHGKALPKANEIAGLVGDAYWHDTQYRFQLYEKGRWSAVSMLTVPTTFGSNQGDFMRDRMEISLIGKDAIKDSYRAAGPFHSILGWLWERTGAEFTPGQTYYFRIQALPRGLPFYESGCKNGQVTCEGQEGSSEEAYSEAVEIKWVAPENVERSLFKWFKDFQKKFQVL